MNSCILVWQVFHVCESGKRQSSFICPKGTIFNQKHRGEQCVSSNVAILLKRPISCSCSMRLVVQREVRGLG